MRYSNGCKGCGACCKTVGFDIPPPKTLEDFEDIKWHLYHKGLSVFIDRDDEWTVEVQTKCKQLGPDNNCKVYEDRPPMCSTFDSTQCDIMEDDENPDVGREFLTAKDVDEYVNELVKAGKLKKR